MEIPADRRYSQSHQWARAENDGTISVGVTDFAQEQLGDVIFIEHPKIGRLLKKDEQCGVIESVKSASDLHSPVAGEVVAVNAALENAPEKVNDNAYDAWIFKVRNSGASGLESLLDGDEYRALVGS